MTKISLYYADWCGHCKSFKPVWDGLKKVFDKNNIEYEEFEDSKDDEVMLRDNIEAYPTIMIENNSGKYQYNGGRDADSILREFLLCNKEVLIRRNLKLIIKILYKNLHQLYN